MNRSSRRSGLVAAVAGLAAAMSMTACGSSGQVGPNAKVTLTILTHVNPPTQKALTNLDAAFHRKYPNITVQISAVPDAQVASVRNTRSEARSLDITEVQPFQGAANPSYVKGQPPNPWGQLIAANQFMDLSGQGFLTHYDSTALDKVGRVQGKVYAVPTGRSISNGVYYNKTIFARYHLSVPKTWSEFLAVCRKLKAGGVTPLMIGGKDGWPAGQPLTDVLQDLYPTEAARRQLDAGLWTGSVKYTDPLNVEALEKQKALYQYAQPGFAGTSYQSAPGRFAAGKAAMTPDGSWSAPIIEQANPKLSFGYFPLPGSDSAATNAQWGGKYEVGWSVLSSSPHHDAALKWLSFYSDPTNYAKFIATNGFIPAEPNVNSTSFIDSLGVTNQNFSLVYPQLAIKPVNAAQQASFDYSDIAPIGKYTDMAALARVEQAAWDKATK